MPKATATDLRNDGWRSQQFGEGFASDAAFDTYLEGALAEAAAWARAKLGASVYDDATEASYGEYAIKRAERQHAGASLWKRRAAFADSSALNGLQGSEYLNRREYLTHAETAMRCAVAALTDAATELGVTLSGVGDIPALSVGYIETGRYTQSSDDPINDD